MLNWVLSSGLLVSFALALVVPGGFAVGMVILFVLSLWFSWRGGQTTRAVLARSDHWLLWVLAAYGLGMMGFVLLDGAFLREMDRPSRFILALPVLLMLLRQPFHRDWLWYGTILGAIGACVVAYYERFYLGKYRADGGIVAIMFGDIAMMLGVINLVAFLYFYQHRRVVLLLLALVAALMGVAASFLSGSRGGWVALPLILLFIVWQGRALLGNRLSGALALGMVAVVVLAVAIPSVGVQGRLLDVVHDLQQYTQGNVNTSVGLRLDMWHGAWYLFKEAPLLGVGSMVVWGLSRLLRSRD